IRYAGTDTALVVPAFTMAADEPISPSIAAMKSAFEAAHKSRFGFIDQSKELVVEAVSVEAIGGGAQFTQPGASIPPAPPPPPVPGAARAFLSGGHGLGRCCLPRARARPGPKFPRPRHYHGAASDRGGRGRLAGRDHRQEPSRAGARGTGLARACHWHA